MINEIENHVQALKNLYICIIYLQELIDNSEYLDYVYDTLTDYLMVVERTAKFLSRLQIVLKSLKIEEAINNELK